MNRSRTLCIVTFLAGLLAACAEDLPPPDVVASKTMATITGHVEFSERIGLTPESRLELQLMDVSLADAAASEIANKAIDNPGQTPIPFTIEYDPEGIDERMSYSVSAKVYDGGKLIFVSDSHNPVLTRGANGDVTVQAVRVIANKQSMRDAPFIGTRWRLLTVQGKKVSEVNRGGTPYFRAADTGRIGGFAGCNQFSGAYTLSDGRLVIGNLTSTMSVCPHGQEIEDAFLAVLGGLRQIAIRGHTMSAYDDSGLLATFDVDRRR